MRKHPKKHMYTNQQNQNQPQGSGVETPMHTMNRRSLLIDTNIQSKQHCNTVLLLIILTIIDTQFLKNLKKKKQKKSSGITNPKNSN